MIIKILKPYLSLPRTIQRILCILCALNSFMLSGCAYQCKQDCPPVSPGYYSPPRVCCCLEKDPQLINKVREHDIQIERMGDQVLLILPSDRFFYGKSTRLNPDRYPDLADLITFINCFQKIEVKIVGYTDCCGCADENLALTKTQATNLASHLWQYGLDARLVYPVGYGSFCPIANDRSACGKNRNRRIEITLTHLPPGVYEE